MFPSIESWKAGAETICAKYLTPGGPKYFSFDAPSNYSMPMIPLFSCGRFFVLTVS
jgi:hypothetical protein